jgi:hypothetical protein
MLNIFINQHQFYLMKSLSLTAFLLFFSVITFAQHTAVLSQGTAEGIKIPRINLGAEIQAYAAGASLGARADLYLGKHVNWNFRLSYHFLNRQRESDINIEEKGGGFGAALGYRYFLDKREGIFFGGRADFRKMNIDWVAESPFSILTYGTTEVSILQPTVEVGYQFKINKHWTIAPAISSGFNLNLITNGERVTGGFIAHIGVNAAFKLLQ